MSPSLSLQHKILTHQHPGTVESVVRLSRDLEGLFAAMNAPSDGLVMVEEQQRVVSTADSRLRLDCVTPLHAWLDSSGRQAGEKALQETIGQFACQATSGIASGEAVFIFSNTPQPKPDIIKRK